MSEPSKLHRIQVKIFVENPSGIDLSALIPVFHKWIQTDALDEMLIDVADYEHVEDGPGILLIAHEADYALDLAGGRPGLLYTRKRDVPESLQDALELALRRVFTAGLLLQEDGSLEHPYRFKTDELEIHFLDRLRIPNEEASLEVVRDGIEQVLKHLYEVDDVTIATTDTDPRLPFGVHVTLPEHPELAALAGRLELSD